MKAKTLTLVAIAAVFLLNGNALAQPVPMKEINSLVQSLIQSQIMSIDSVLRENAMANSPD